MDFIFAKALYAKELNASMPKVKLYIKTGEQYSVKELLYSLMLESHKTWWQNFWKQCFVTLYDEELENMWYTGIYFMACCSRTASARMC